MKITIDRSLVEQALERLALYHHNNGFFDDAVVITALRAALAEPVQEPDNGGKTGWPPGLLQDDCRGLSKWLASRPDARQRLREALAEPVQEPVAIVGTQADTWKGYGGQWAPPGPPIKTVHMLRELPEGTLLYAAPFQRMPLSEDEIFAIENDIPDAVISDRAWTIWLSRAVEAAHGIK